MKKTFFLSLAALLVSACLAGPLAAQVAAQAGGPDKPADVKKLLAEIAGDYEFALPGMPMTVQFTAKDEQLYGAPVGQPEEPINPVEGKPLCFDITVADSGDYYVLQFVRNDKGVIDKCIMTVQGMVIEGTKIIK